MEQGVGARYDRSRRADHISFVTNATDRQLVLVALLYWRVDDNLVAATREIAVPLNIRNEAVNQLAKKLAARKRLNKTKAVKVALENELQRTEKSQPLRERLRPLQHRVLARPATGLEADKSFYDDLSGLD